VIERDVALDIFNLFCRNMMRTIMARASDHLTGLFRVGQVRSYICDADPGQHVRRPLGLYPQVRQEVAPHYRGPISSNAIGVENPWRSPVLTNWRRAALVFVVDFSACVAIGKKVFGELWPTTGPLRCRAMKLTMADNDAIIAIWDRAT
jgi:hypothetical protein